MDSNNIDKSVIVPVQPKTYRLEPQNEAIAVTQARYSDRFIGFCRVDPRQEEAITELRRCVLQIGLKGLLLHPIEEGYTINEDYAVRLMKEAGSLGVPVIVAAGYPWVAHALQIRSVAEQAEEATIIMSHVGATGSIGRLVVDEVFRQSHAVRAAWGRATAVATCNGAAHFVERAASLYVAGTVIGQRFVGAN